MPAFEALAARHGAGDRRGRLRGARRAPRATARAVGGARAPGGVRLLRQQAADDRRGRDGHAGRRAPSSSASTPSATRAARRTWAGSTTTGWASTTACRTSPAPSAWRSCERLDEMLAGARARGRAATAQALAGIEGLELPCPDAGGDVRGWFVFVVQLPRGRRPRRDRARARASAACRASPTCPAIHLMSFYRERFGHREGEFPVCEDVAARSLALPFFPDMTRGPGRSASPRRAARAAQREAPQRPPSVRAMKDDDLLASPQRTQHSNECAPPGTTTSVALQPAAGQVCSAFQRGLRERASAAVLSLLKISQRGQLARGAVQRRATILRPRRAARRAPPAERQVNGLS